MLELEKKCIHPTSKNRYIKSATGGIDNSPEGKQVLYSWSFKSGNAFIAANGLAQGGVTHVFVSEFDNEEDRAYYLDHDPAHQDFKKMLATMASTVRVVDFTPGVFGHEKLQ